MSPFNLMDDGFVSTYMRVNPRFLARHRLKPFIGKVRWGCYYNEPREAFEFDSDAGLFIQRHEYWWSELILDDKDGQLVIHHPARRGEPGAHKWVRTYKGEGNDIRFVPTIGYFENFAFRFGVGAYRYKNCLVTDLPANLLPVRRRALVTRN